MRGGKGERLLFLGFFLTEAHVMLAPKENLGRVHV
jgi:hypothetical protein